MVSTSRTLALGFSVALVAASFLLGARRLPDGPRLEALPPGFDPRPRIDSRVSRNDPGKEPPGDGEERPPPLRESPWAFRAFLPTGGMQAFREIGDDWYDNGRLEIVFLPPRDLCARFARVPSICIHDEGAPPEILSMLRRGAEKFQIPERRDCPDLQGVMLFVSDRLNDAEILLPLGRTDEIAIARHKVTLSATGNPASPTLTLRPPGGPPASIRLDENHAASIQTSIAGATIRMAISLKQKNGDRFVHFHDMHLVCP